MPLPVMTTLPAPPVRGMAADAFDAAADEFLTALPNFVFELNTYGEALPAVITGTDFTGTSATSITIGTGSKVFTAGTGKNWQIGQAVRVASTASPANYMDGQVVAYNSGTGSLTVNVTVTGGSGTIATWTIFPLPSGGTFVTLGGTETLTNKTLTNPTIGGASSTVLGRLGMSSGLLTFGDGTAAQVVVTVSGTQTLSNKTLFSPTLTGNPVAPTQASTDSSTLVANTAFVQSAITASGGRFGFSGLKIAATGVSNYVAVVTASSVILAKAGGGTFVATGVSVSPNINTSGANGLDTGALAASTWYYVYVIYNPTTSTVAGLFSASSTAPALPSGYTHFARVGTVRTDSSGSKYLLQTLQFGDQAQYVPLSGSNLTAPPVIANTATGSTTFPTWTSTSVANFFPPTTSAVRLRGIASGGGSVMAAPSNAYGATSSTTNQPPLNAHVQAVSQFAAEAAEFALETANTIYIAIETGTIFALGWTDNL